VDALPRHEIVTSPAKNSKTEILARNGSRTDHRLCGLSRFAKSHLADDKNRSSSYRTNAYLVCTHGFRESAARSSEDAAVANHRFAVHLTSRTCRFERVNHLRIDRRGSVGGPADHDHVGEFAVSSEPISFPCDTRARRWWPCRARGRGKRCDLARNLAACAGPFSNRLKSCCCAGPSALSTWMPASIATGATRSPHHVVEGSATRIAPSESPCPFRHQTQCAATVRVEMPGGRASYRRSVPLGQFVSILSGFAHDHQRRVKALARARAP